jgi:hypothetical protein
MKQNTKIAIAFVVSIVMLAALSTATSAMPTFQSPTPVTSPLPTPVAMTEKVYLPIIFKNYPNLDAPEPIVPCDIDDPARGPLYRSLVTNTTALLYPFMAWSMIACNCGLGTARANGTAVGQIAGKVFRIIRLVFEIIWHAIQAAISLIGDIIGMILGAATPPSIVCTGDVELLCFGIATIASLDAMANGIITTIVMLVLAILSFYLGIYVIKEVRQIMQPGDDE